MFSAFEKALVTGEHTLTSAKTDGQNSPRIRESVIVKNRIHCHKVVDNLQVGERLQRTWACSKPDCYRSLGMDEWCYREDVSKLSDDEISVEHTLLWHAGKSRASQKYIARNVDGRVFKDADDWIVNMDGLKWPIRGFVESAMRKKMTTTQ
jgi:hypothetical protein